jgi:hypothetical protein
MQATDLVKKIIFWFYKNKLAKNQYVKLIHVFENLVIKYIESTIAYYIATNIT